VVPQKEDRVFRPGLVSEIRREFSVSAITGYRSDSMSETLQVLSESSHLGDELPKKEKNFPTEGWVIGALDQEVGLNCLFPLLALVLP